MIGRARAPRTDYGEGVVDSPHAPHGSHVFRRDRNRDTILPGQLAAFRDQLPQGAFDGFLLAPPATKTEMLAAYARVRAAHGPMKEPGYRLYWVSGMLMGHVDVPLREDAYAIVGRHTQCDLCLEGDPSIALRHLLVRSVRLADGSVALRVLDLRTTLGFFLEADARMRSVFASGPLSFRVGSYCFVAVPSDVDLPEEAPRSLVEQAEAPPPSLPAGSPYREPGMRRSGAVSRITLLPAPPMLESLAPARVGHRRITLLRGERQATIELSDAQLDVGVLLGRAEKCVDEGLRCVLSECISRVHLLLLREGGAYYAFDAGSTNGVFQNHRQVRRIRLADEGTVFSLSKAYSVHVYWHPRR